MSGRTFRMGMMAAMLGATSFLQGCFPGAGLGALALAGAGTYGIVETTNTISDVGDATESLINTTESELSATAGQLRENMQQITDSLTNTLAQIDSLVASLEENGDDLTESITNSIDTLTAEVANQIRGLEEIRAEVVALIQDGRTGLDGILESLNISIDNFSLTLEALNQILRIVGRLPEAVKGAETARVATAEVTDPQALDSAVSRYWETRGRSPAAAEAPAAEGTATPMPAFAPPESTDDGQDS